MISGLLVANSEIPAKTYFGEELVPRPRRLALMNLTQNAIRYSPPGKLITLSGRVEGDWAVIEVADEGPGIAPEHVPRLTERFYRVDVRESRAQGGTGLGLALVKHILNRHHGRLSIESMPGAGATFTVYLPLAGLGAGDKPTRNQGDGLSSN